MRRTEVKRHKTRDMADGKRREAGEVMRREAGEVWMLLPSFMGNRVFTNPGRSEKTSKTQSKHWKNL